MKHKSCTTLPDKQWIHTFQDALTAWYHSCARDLPWRRTQDPYAIWISEIMLQQTQVDTVIPYYERFLDALPTISALAQAEDEVLMKLWEGLGYYTRARNLKQAAQVILTQYGGALPADGASLLKLPGIGPYTAGAIGSIAFGLPLPAVDGNVIRVYSRLLAVTANADTTVGKKCFAALGAALVDARDPSAFNQAVMELGALICSPNGPRCHSCPVSVLCEACRQSRPLDFPVRSPKGSSKTLHWAVTIYHRPGQIFLVPRSDETLLKGLWGFPMTQAGASDAAEDPEQGKGTVLGSVKHVFTHQVWLMTVRLMPSEDSDAFAARFPGGIWVDGTALKKRPLPKAFSKILPLIDDRMLTL